VQLFRCGKGGQNDIGLTGKDIHEARSIRDAETAEPGIVRDALDAALDAGSERTRQSLSNLSLRH
jgi:hypothetical protein